MKNLQGSLWKLKKNNVTGLLFWKRKYVYVDEEKFLHWQQETKPSAGISPNHAFVLNKCTVKSSETRDWAFEISDSVSKLVFVFALDSPLDFDSWINFLTLHCYQTKRVMITKPILDIEHPVSEDQGQKDLQDFRKSLRVLPPSLTMQSLAVHLPQGGENENIVPPVSNINIPTSLEGVLWKLRQTSVTSTKQWKKKYVYMDLEKVLVWRAESKPPASVLPNHGLVLEQCTIEESNLRQYAFQIKDNKTQDVFVFAADNVVTYEEWLSLLNYSHMTFSQRVAANIKLAKAHVPVEDEASEYSDFKPLEADIIADFFEKFNTSEDFRHAQVDEHQLRDLISILNDYCVFVNPNVCSVIYANLHLPPGAPITRSSFQHWMSEYRMQSAQTTDHNLVTLEQDRGGGGLSSSPTGSPSQSADDVIRHFNFRQANSSIDVESSSFNVFDRKLKIQQSSHFVGVVDSDLLVADRNVDRVYAVVIPPANSVHVLPLKVLDPSEDWNSVFQSAVDMTVGFTSGGVPINKSQLTATALSAHLFDVEGGASSLSVSVPVEQVKTSNLLLLSAIQGAFLEMAKEGTMKLVDAMSLPVHMKSDLVCFSSTRDGEVTDNSRFLGNNSSGTTGHSSLSEEMFGYDGLVLRVIESGAVETDSQPTDNRLRYLCAHDEIQRKVAGNEQRGLAFVQNSIYAMQHNHVREGGASNKLLRPCTTLSTVVDYCGYRVSAVCPMEIDELATMVHGYFAQDDIFVNALPSVRTIIPKLAARLGLSINKRTSAISTVPIIERTPSHETTAKIDFVSLQMQFHKSSDGRVYLLNHHSLLPPDLPRPHTTESLYLRVRPELLSTWVHQLGNTALSCECFNNDDEDDDSGVSEDDYNDDDYDDENEEDDLQHSQRVRRRRRVRVIGDRDTDSGDELNPQDQDQDHHHLSSSPMQVRNLMSAYDYMYTKSLPCAAEALDMLAIVPLDSFGVTKFMHSQGLNCRHLGKLLDLTTQSFAKLTLFSEAVARCCKTILNQSLRLVARKGKAASILAECRGRSLAANYMEHNDSLRSARPLAALDLFNLVLGSGTACVEFWQGHLSDFLLQKFGIGNSFDRFYNKLHFPQLFHAMQYHTGLKFHDRSDFSFGNIKTEVGETHFPLRLSDLAQDAFVPVCKFKDNLPGEFGAADQLGEVLLGCGNYTDALSVFATRLSVQKTAVGCSLSLKDQYLLAHSLYKLCITLYLSNQLEHAQALIMDYLQNNPKYSAISARFIGILMCIDFKLGNFHLSMSYFDAAHDIYSFVLGPVHPILTVHSVLLADLYQAAGQTNHARLMMLVTFESCRRALGEGHVVNAMHAYKLAVVLMQESQYAESSELLLNVLTIFEAQLKRSSEVKDALNEATAHCLNALAISLSHCDKLDHATHYATEALEIFSKLSRRSVTPLMVSSLLLLADLYHRKHDSVAALNITLNAWNVVKQRTTDYDEAGSILGRLSCQALSVLFSALSFPVHTLLQSIAQEMETKVAKKLVSSKDWNLAFVTLSQALWTSNPKDYFETLIKSVQSRPAAIGSESVQKGGPSMGNRLQIYLVLKLIAYAHAEKIIAAN